MSIRTINLGQIGDELRHGHFVSVQHRDELQVEDVSDSQYWAQACRHDLVAHSFCYILQDCLETSPTANMTTCVASRMRVQRRQEGRPRTAL